MIITPGLLDAIMAAVGLEFALIAAALWRWNLRQWILPVFWFLASGALLMSALRLALSGSAAQWMALPLLGSLFTHLFLLLTVWQRIKKARPGTGPG